MQNSVRNTGKLNPFEFVGSVSFNTSSVIKIQQYLAGSRVRNIQWRRRCEDLIERLHHLDGLFEYICSQLDKDFTIQAILDVQVFGQNKIQSKINLYGPIALPPQYSFLIQDLGYKHEEFQVDIISSKKIYSCIVSFVSDQIYLKNKNMSNNLQFLIPTSDSINCFVQKSNGVDLLIFPNFYIKVAMLKVFNQIMANYHENFEPVMMKMPESHIFNSSVKANAKWKKLLLRLNFLKQDNSRRMSMPQIISHVVKMPVQEQPEPKKLTDRYSMDIASVPENGIKQSHNNMKKSQTFQRNTKPQKKPNNFLNNENDLVGSQNQCEAGTQAAGQELFAEFQGVLFDGNEPQQQVIQLNDSFQQFEKKNKSQKEMKMWQQVRANKMHRAQNNRRKQLQKTLQDLVQKNEQLLKTNQKLKQELQTQKNQNFSAIIGSERLKLAHLRREYQKMLEQTNKKYEQMGRVASNMQRSGKY